jgi:hypothetical protein
MKSSVFWDIAPRNAMGPAYHLLHDGFFLALFFNPEDGGNVSSEASVDFYQTTRRYIPEDSLEILIAS